MRNHLSLWIIASGIFVANAVGSAPVVAQAGRFRPTSRLTTARMGHTATVLPSGQVLIVGGPADGNADTGSSTELYDPATGTFTATGDMNSPRYSPVAVLLNDGTVLIAGGCWGSGYSCDSLASAELYDPASGTFTATGSMNTPRVSLTATVLNDGTVLIAGGCSGSGYSCASLSSAELYDPASGTFTATTGSMTSPRALHSATLLNNGQVLIAGGETHVNAGDLASAELYDPTSGTFTATGSMTFGGDYRQATLLNTGKVLIAGGWGRVQDGEYEILADATLYDPATETFTATGSLSIGRYAHTGTLLNNGMVLITGGGAPDTGAPYNPTTGELYDPTTGTFDFTGDMSSGRSYFTATLLDDGEVLIAGGSNADGIEDGAELYAPPYAFTGFFQPVDNLPTCNSVKAGSAIPVKFGLGGYMGMGVLASGYPQSVRINCAGGVPQDAVEETVTAGSSSLSYDAAADRYIYVWRTDRNWAGTCRQLTVRLGDGSDHRANFSLTR